MLAMHENVQDKILEEIKEVCGKTDNLEITYEDMLRLKYIEMVVKETLRLFSPAFGLFRETKTDVDLGKSGEECLKFLINWYFLGIYDISLPKGTNLIVNLYSMHRKESIWGANANNFDPNHFLPEAKEKRNFYGFTPFGKGLRMCIGKFSS